MSKNWFVIRTSSSVNRIREIMMEERLDFFFPTYHATISAGNRNIQKEKALTLDLLFVHCGLNEMERACENHKVLHPIYRRRPILKQERQNTTPENSYYLTVPEKQMGYFIRTVGMYQNNIPFVSPKEIDMTKGDVVRITSGPFQGIEGVLMSEQGKDGGRVLVHISDIVAIPTMSIAPECLEILHFAPAGKHAYKKFDAFQKRLDTAIANWDTELGLTDTDIRAMRSFITRYSNLMADTKNYQAKLLTFLIMAHRLLGHPHEEYHALEKELRNIQTSLTSKSCIAFINKYIDFK